MTAPNAGMLRPGVGSENLWQKFTSAFGPEGGAAGMTSSRGLSARALLDAVLDGPAICVLLGKGTGGGASALLPADRVICAQHSWPAPLREEPARRRESRLKRYRTLG